MGAKTADNTNKRMYKCEHCDLSFQAAITLKSHLRVKHQNTERKVEESVPNEVKKTGFAPPTARVSKRIQLKKKTSDAAKMPAENLETSAKGRKAQFECPICLKLFPVYFSAAKHIEKKHSSDCTDENSSNADVKPTLRETCTLCDKLIIDGNHECKVSHSSDGGAYSCLGCDKKFDNVENFDHHVSTAHYTNVEDMSFNDISEFHTWKNTMESQVHVKYVTLSNSSDKQYYQCNYVSPKNSAEITHLCPSIVTLKQTRKGVRILYYKTHNHVCPEYKRPPNQLNDLDSIDIKSESTDSNLHEKFVDLMKNIIERSEGLNTVKLRKLYQLASKMDDIIISECTKSDNENEDLDGKRSINKNMTDDQITKALETPRNQRMKRGNNSYTPNIMKKKKVSDTSLKENNSLSKNVSPVVGKPRPSISSPSFNDSYKEFIGGTKSPVTTNKESQNVKTSKKPRKEIVKTKMGQFTPSPEKKSQGLLKKDSKKSPNSSLNNFSLDRVDFEVVEQENDCNIIVLKL